MIHAAWHGLQWITAFIRRYALVLGFISLLIVFAIGQINDAGQRADIQDTVTQLERAQELIVATGVRGRRETCRFAAGEQKQDRESIVTSDAQLASPEFKRFVDQLGITRERLHELNVIRYYVEEGNYLLPSYCRAQRLDVEDAPSNFAIPRNIDKLRKAAHPAAYRSWRRQSLREREERRERRDPPQAPRGERRDGGGPDATITRDSDGSVARTTPQDSPQLPQQDQTQEQPQSHGPETQPAIDPPQNNAEKQVVDPGSVPDPSETPTPPVPAPLPAPDVDPGDSLPLLP